MEYLSSVLGNLYPFVMSMKDKVGTGYSLRCLGSLFIEHRILTSADIKSKTSQFQFGDKSTKENVARVNVGEMWQGHLDNYIIDICENLTATVTVGNSCRNI